MEEPKECRDGHQRIHTQTIIHREVKSLLVEMFHPKVRRSNHEDRMRAIEETHLRDKKRIHYRTQAANKINSS